jgi:hypothetical protein
MNCRDCNAEVLGNYCPNCGTAAKFKRIDWHYLVHEVEHLLHFERGILFTIRALVTSPGQHIRDFLDGKRNKLVKPIAFIVVTSLIYTLINHFFHIEERYMNGNEMKDSAISSVFK